MLRKFWNNDIARYNKVKHAISVLWNKYQKNKLGETRAFMHMVPFHIRSELIEQSNKIDYKWVIITKQL